jgi:hypothetical protein
MSQLLSDIIKTLRKRSLGEGGFANLDNGHYRTDATAWGILALIAEGNDNQLVSLCQSRLAASQLSEGRVCISSQHPEVYWPTSLAILAWQHSSAYQPNLERAVQFLLSNSGTHWERRPDSPVAHDESLKGWPWTAATHSWIAPTALTVIALKSAGYGHHPRVVEAGRLILDRQCASGGWNYGNTAVFGAQLRPMPEDTGLGLNAMKDLTPRSKLEPSLAYLHGVVKSLRTPISLACSILGLGAWGERPAAASAWLADCWRRQERYGDYDTTSLSLLVLASCLSGGLESLFDVNPAA